MTSGSGIYFSVDTSATNLRGYNFPNGNGSDPQDWDSSVSDSYNAYLSPGAKADISPTDYAVMDVLGYQLNTTAHSWALSGGGNWSAAGNWVNYGAPSGSGIQVVFGTFVNTSPTITLDVAATAGTLTFNNAAFGYVLSGSQTLTLQTPSGNAAIQVLAGRHQISASLALASNTDVTVTNPTDSLTLAGNISGTGSLAMFGSGLLTLSGSNGYSGATIVNGGVLAAGTTSAVLAKLQFHRQRGHARRIGAGRNRPIAHHGRGGTLKLTPGNLFTTTGAAGFNGTLDILNFSGGSAVLMNYGSSSGTFTSVFPAGARLTCTPTQLDLFLPTSTIYNLAAAISTPLIHAGGTAAVSAAITNAGSGSDDILTTQG